MNLLGSDHGGFALKEHIKQFLQTNKYDVKDYGCYDTQQCDYPDIAKTVCENYKVGDKILLFCGSGIGISIAANKISGIRAACCSDYFSAKFSRVHNDANALCLGGRIVGTGLAQEIVTIFLESNFEGDRHKPRLLKIENLEK
ncbi:MAG: ribose 5-phosphate isomerase B [Oscillospiraceae bacterium]